MFRFAAFAAALLLYPPSALAWGGLGHEAICELAFRELDDTARRRVIALIQLDEEFTTFRASCNWADRPRQRATEHFVNLPRDATGLDDRECPLAEECVVSAIKDDFAVLASTDATDEEKLAAQVSRPLGGRHPPAAARCVSGRQGRQSHRHAGQLVRESAYALGQLPRRGAARDAFTRDRPNSRPASPTISGPRGWPAIRWTGRTNRSRSPVSSTSGTASWSVTPVNTRPTTASSRTASPGGWSWWMTAIWTGTQGSCGNGSRGQAFAWPAYSIGRWVIRALSAELLGRTLARPFVQAPGPRSRR
jgi:hypothetical protein